MANKLLENKVGLIMGVANDRSIATAIGKCCHAHGANLIISYQNERLKERIEQVSPAMGSPILVECDVSSADSIEALIDIITLHYGKLDFIVHSIGFSDKNELRGRFVDTSYENFSNTMNISCYSLVRVLRHLEPVMAENATVLTLTYYGSEKVVPNYNVMGVAKAALEASVRYLAYDYGEKGIRINAISSGPIKTLAASGISGFSTFLKASAGFSPLQRSTTLEDVANASVFLLSDLSSGITGQIMHVDCGYSIMGMQLPEDK